jgi:cation diffusion facilitator family transporter
MSWRRIASKTAPAMPEARAAGQSDPDGCSGRQWPEQTLSVHNSRRRGPGTSSMLNNQKESSARTAVIAGAFDTAMTIVAMLLSNSAVLLADSLKTALEFIAVLLAWLSIRRITRGGGQDYEFGIGKLENLASLVIGALMLIVFLVIVGNAIRSIISPSHIAGVGLWISIAGQVVYAVINGVLFVRARRGAKTEHSPIMESQAKLFFTRCFGNVFIFLSLVLSIALAKYSWSVYIDPVAALVVAATIVMSAIGVFSSSCYDLLDGAIEEEDKLKIMRALAENFDRYDMIYGIRSRRSGSRAFIEIFLGFDPAKLVGDVERDIEAIRQAVSQHFASGSVIVVMGPEPKTPPPTIAIA